MYPIGRGALAIIDAVGPRASAETAPSPSSRSAYFAVTSRALMIWQLAEAINGISRTIKSAKQDVILNAPRIQAFLLAGLGLYLDRHTPGVAAQILPESLSPIAGKNRRNQAAMPGADL